MDLLGETYDPLVKLLCVLGAHLFNTFGALATASPGSTYGGS